MKLKISKIKYKGYTIAQSDYYNHIVIFDKDGKMISHWFPNRRLDKEELKREIYRFVKRIEFVEKVE